MIVTLSTRQTIEKLRAAGLSISDDTLRNGLEQRVFPFGNVIRTSSGNPVVYIYGKLLDEWIEEREDKHA